MNSDLRGQSQRSLLGTALHHSLPALFRILENLILLFEPFASGSFGSVVAASLEEYRYWIRLGDDFWASFPRAPRVCSHLFVVCVSPEEYRKLDFTWRRLHKMCPYFVQCLVPQRVLVRTSVHGAVW